MRSAGPHRLWAQSISTSRVGAARGLLGDRRPCFQSSPRCRSSQSLHNRVASSSCLVAPPSRPHRIGPRKTACGIMIRLFDEQMSLCCVTWLISVATPPPAKKCGRVLCVPDIASAKNGQSCGSRRPTPLQPTALLCPFPACAGGQALPNLVDKIRQQTAMCEAVSCQESSRRNFPAQSAGRVLSQAVAQTGPSGPTSPPAWVTVRARVYRSTPSLRSRGSRPGAVNCHTHWWTHVQSGHSRAELLHRQGVAKVRARKVERLRGVC